MSFLNNLFSLDNGENKKLFENLYETVNSHSISHIARDKIGAEASAHLIYGELEFQALERIYKNRKIMNKIKTSKKFYDLGSGSGRIVLGSNILLPTINEFIGIEFLKELYEISNTVKKDFSEIDKNKAEKINFINDDFFNINYTDADIIFLHFPMKNAEYLYLKLEEKLSSELKKGTIIISVIREFVDKKNFVKFDKIKIQTSYGKTAVHCHYKI